MPCSASSVVCRLFNFRAVYHRRLGFNARGYESLDDPLDIASNIVAYLPLGIILGGLGPLRAIIIAGLISSGVEAGQLVMMHRDPSFTDVLSNVVGAALGALATARWAIRPRWCSTGHAMPTSATRWRYAWPAG